MSEAAGVGLAGVPEVAGVGEFGVNIADGVGVSGVSIAAGVGEGGIRGVCVGVAVSVAAPPGVEVKVDVATIVAAGVAVAVCVAVGEPGRGVGVEVGGVPVWVGCSGGEVRVTVGVSDCNGVAVLVGVFGRVPPCSPPQACSAAAANETTTSGAKRVLRLTQGLYSQIRAVSNPTDATAISDETNASVIDSLRNIGSPPRVGDYRRLLGCQVVGQRRGGHFLPNNEQPNNEQPNNEQPTPSSIPTSPAAAFSRRGSPAAATGSRSALPALRYRRGCGRRYRR